VNDILPAKTVPKIASGKFCH